MVQIVERQRVGLAHGADVKAGNLIVVQVGVDKEGGGELVLHLDDGRGVHARVLQPGAVLAKILADRGHDRRALAQQGQAVGDVGRTAAPLLAHRVHQKAEADLVDLLGQDVLAESVPERTSSSQRRRNR